MVDTVNHLLIETFKTNLQSKRQYWFTEFSILYLILHVKFIEYASCEYCKNKSMNLYSL